MLLVANRKAVNPVVYSETTEQSQGMESEEQISEGRYSSGDINEMQQEETYRRTIEQQHMLFMSSEKSNEMFKQFYKNDKIGYNYGTRFQALPIHHKLVNSQMPVEPKGVLEYEKSQRAEIAGVFDVPITMITGETHGFKDATLNMMKQFHRKIGFYIAWFNQQFTRIYNNLYTEHDSLFRYYYDTEAVELANDIANGEDVGVLKQALSGLEDDAGEKLEEEYKHKVKTLAVLRQLYEKSVLFTEGKNESLQVKLFLPVYPTEDPNELIIQFQIGILPYPRLVSMLNNRNGPSAIPPFPNGIITEKDKTAFNKMMDESKLVKYLKDLQESKGKKANDQSKATTTSSV